MMHPSYSYVANAAQLNGLSGLESSWGIASTYMTAEDGAGNSFHVYNDGKIILAVSKSGKGQGTVWKAGTASYDSVLAALRKVSNAQSLRIDTILGGGGVSATGSNQGTDGVMSWVSDLFGKASTKEEKAYAWQQASGAAKEYGPGFIQGVMTLVNNKGSSLASLQKQLAKKKSQYQTTTNERRKLDLKYQIEALEMQIAQYGQASSSAQDLINQSTGGSSAKSPVQWWIPVGILGGVGLLAVIAFSARRRRG